MADLDLNINNYSICDLESFFKLNPNSTYTAADIELQETVIREQLLSSGHIDKRVKNDLMDFLNGCDTIDLVMENGITKIEK